MDEYFFLPSRNLQCTSTCRTSNMTSSGICSGTENTDPSCCSHVTRLMLPDTAIIMGLLHKGLAFLVLPGLSSCGDACSMLLNDTVPGFSGVTTLTRQLLGVCITSSAIWKIVSKLTSQFFTSRFSLYCESWFWSP